MVRHGSQIVGNEDTSEICGEVKHLGIGQSRRNDASRHHEIEGRDALSEAVNDMAIEVSVRQQADFQADLSPRSALYLRIFSMTEAGGGFCLRSSSYRRSPSSR